MPGKSKVAVVSPEPAPPGRKGKLKAIHHGAPDLSEREVDEMLERIRIRGAKISADLDALSSRLGLP